MDEYVKDEGSRTRKQLLNWKVTRDELKPKISNCFILLRNLKAKDVPLERVELKLHAEKIEVRVNITKLKGLSIAYALFLKHRETNHL